MVFVLLCFVVAEPEAHYSARQSGEQSSLDPCILSLAT